MSAIALLVMALSVRAAAPKADPAVERDLDQRFAQTVRPFVEKFCTDCHGGEKPEAHLDLSRFQTMAAVVDDYPHWATVLEKLAAKEMPPKCSSPAPAAG